MMSTTVRKLLPLACAGLLCITHITTPSLGQHAGTATPAPIELSGIAIEYAVLNEVGNLVWATPTPAKPNVIPSESQRLRFRATVNNRHPGARIRMKAVLQEVCPSPDAGKRFLTKLRHLTKTDDGQITQDPADDEEQVVKADGTVSIEILVHCETCGEVTCSKKCGAHRDHLGEGPHSFNLTTTDVPPAARDTSPPGARHTNSTAVMPSSFRVDLMSVCPAQQKPRGSRPALRPRAVRTSPRARLFSKG